MAEFLLNITTNDFVHISKIPYKFINILRHSYVLRITGKIMTSLTQVCFLGSKNI